MDKKIIKTKTTSPSTNTLKSNKTTSQSTNTLKSNKTTSQSTNTLKSNKTTSPSTNTLSSNKTASSSTNTLSSNKTASSSTNTLSSNKTASSSKNTLSGNKTNSSSNNSTNNKQPYNFKLFDIELDKLKGIYPIMFNINKFFSVLNSKNIKVTPNNSYRVLGEYVNRYNKLDETFEYKIEKYKNFIQLNNDFNTIIETILLFSQTGKISPRSLINVINNLILFYNEPNKEEILIHYAYLAEIIYRHFSIMMDNDEIDRNSFFDNDFTLDIEAIKECAEFYYTDIYMLNSTEKTELMKVLRGFYLEETQKIKNETNKIIKEEEEDAIKLEVETLASKKSAEEQKAKQKAIKEKMTKEEKEKLFKRKTEQK
jgi:hypothetical protein